MLILAQVTAQMQSVGVEVGQRRGVCPTESFRGSSFHLGATLIPLACTVGCETPSAHLAIFKFEFTKLDKIKNLAPQLH